MLLSEMNGRKLIEDAAALMLEVLLDAKRRMCPVFG